MGWGVRMGAKLVDELGTVNEDNNKRTPGGTSSPINQRPTQGDDFRGQRCRTTGGVFADGVGGEAVTKAAGTRYRRSVLDL